MGVTPNLGLLLPVVGDTADAWGGQLNNNFSVLDGIVASPPPTVTATGTVTPALSGETVELCIAGGSGIVRTLPDPTASAGRIFTFVMIDAGPGAVVISGTINGASGYSLINQWQFVRVIAGGGAWYVIGAN